MARYDRKLGSTRPSNKRNYIAGQANQGDINSVDIDALYAALDLYAKLDSGNGGTGFPDGQIFTGDQYLYDSDAQNSSFVFIQEQTHFEYGGLFILDYDIDSGVDPTVNDTVALVGVNPTNEQTPYNPDVMRYNGTDSFYDEQTDLSTNNQITGVARFSTLPATAQQFIFRENGPTNKIRIGLSIFASDHTDPNRQNKLQMFVQDNTGAQICNLVSPVAVTDGILHTIFASYNGDTGQATFFMDGVDADDPAWSLRLLTTGTLETGVGSIWVGSSDFGQLKLTGDIGYFGLHQVYLTNWTDFMDGSQPKQLDETGWTEWGTQPRFWNDVGTMTVNKGTAPNMTANGTITQVPAPALPPVFTAKDVGLFFNRPTYQGKVQTLYDGPLLVQKMNLSYTELGPTFHWPILDGPAGGTLTTDGDGGLYWTDPPNPPELIEDIDTTDYTVSQVGNLAPVTVTATRPATPAQVSFECTFFTTSNNREVLVELLIDGVQFGQIYLTPLPRGTDTFVHHTWSPVLPLGTEVLTIRHIANGTDVSVLGSVTDTVLALLIPSAAQVFQRTITPYIVDSFDFISRFTDQEKENWSKGMRGEKWQPGPFPPDILVWRLTTFHSRVVAHNVNLTQQFIIDFVNELETIGIIGVGRAAIILTP